LRPSRLESVGDVAGNVTVAIYIIPDSPPLPYPAFPSLLPLSPHHPPVFLLFPKLLPPPLSLSLWLSLSGLVYFLLPIYYSLYRAESRVLIFCEAATSMLSAS
jgi:hypothetical protein